MNTEEKIEYLEKELALEKEKLLEEQREKNRVKKAREYFDKNFPCEMISDDYNIYPQETFQNIMSIFEEDFQLGEEKKNKLNIKQLGEEYINLLKSDVEDLQEAIKIVEEQYKEFIKK